jgi:hypothetical protein
VYVDVWNSFPYCSHDFDISIAIHLGVEPTENPNFGRTCAPRLDRPFDDLIYRQEIGLRIVLSRSEGAKSARPDADIGEVYVSIDYVGDVVTDARLSDSVRGREHRVKISSTHVEQSEGFFLVDSATAFDFFQDVGNSASHCVLFTGRFLAMQLSARFFLRSFTLRIARP